ANRIEDNAPSVKLQPSFFPGKLFYEEGIAGIAPGRMAADFQPVHPIDVLVIQEETAVHAPASLGGRRVVSHGHEVGRGPRERCQSSRFNHEASSVQAHVSVPRATFQTESLTTYRLVGTRYTLYTSACFSTIAER